ncbi:MAG: hypothetical protein Q8O12_04540 [Candidatus Omnitrophota bacterium]|nr:hypothetical protein [Candidatus Omnitrophota bacterium]
MKDNNKGVAIFITLMLLFLLSLIAVTALLTAYNYNNICEAQIRRQKALVSAEAGIHYAFYKLRTDLGNFDDYNSEVDSYSFSPNSGITVKVWVTGPVSGRYTVKSKATYSKAQVQ